MPPKLDPLVIRDLASGQWGLFTTAQVRSRGVTPQQVAHLAETGVLERVRYGVYRITGTPDHPSDSIRSLWLSLQPNETVGQRLEQSEPGGVISHLSAAELLGLGDLPPDKIEVTVPRRRQTRGQDVRFHLGSLKPGDWAAVEGVPTTTPIVTVATLAREHLDGSHLARIVRDALVTNLLTTSDVASALDPYAHFYGAPLGDGDELLDRFLDEAGVSMNMLDLAAKRSARPIESRADVLVKIAQMLAASTMKMRPGEAQELQRQIFLAITSGSGTGLADAELFVDALAAGRPSEIVRAIARVDGSQER